MQHVSKKLSALFTCSKCQGRRRYLSTLNVNINVREHVKEAISKKQPVAALESTIITHGMPFPQNLQTAFSVENVLQRKGVIPATVGIINGKLIIGLDEEEIEYLAKNTEKCIKVSRRDFSYVMSKKMNGGTTVSGTMLAAQMAGIPIFVTGGIGGVHRGAQESFDISADLMELSRTPVAVVCAGVKSILDIPLTLEYLETQGVPVISYASTKDFPSFFSSKSGFKAPYSTQNPSEVASMIYSQKDVLGLNTGLVIGVPIPQKYSVDNKEIDGIIQSALEEARIKNITGKEITPFVLDRVSKSSGGKSLESNIKLIENNASVGADIAIEYSKILQKERYHKESEIRKSRGVLRHQGITHVTQNSGIKRPVVIGSSILDIKSKVTEISSVAESTNEGKVHLSVGGVGRNIAEFLARCGSDPLLISSLGQDEQGEMIFNQMQRLNMDTSAINWSRDQQTATYNVLTSKQTGEVLLAVGDMNINNTINPSLVMEQEKAIKDSAIVILDGNIPEVTIDAIMAMCRRHRVPVWYEPTCYSKASKPFKNKTNKHIEFVSPNFVELTAIHEQLTGIQQKPNENPSTTELLHLCIKLSKVCCNYVNNMIITLGKHGVLLVSSRRVGFKEHDKTLAYLHYPAVPEHLSPVKVNNVSGAGDSLAGGIIYGFLQDYDKDTCIKAGLLGAYHSLCSSSAICESLNPSMFKYESIHRWANFNPHSLIPRE